MQQQNPNPTPNNDENLQQRFERISGEIKITTPELSNAKSVDKTCAWIAGANITGCVVMSYGPGSLVQMLAVSGASITICLMLIILNAYSTKKNPPQP